MREIIFLDPAKEEMADAAEYYGYQKEGLGLEFLEEIEHTIRRIQEFPKSGKMLIIQIIIK